jgi:hypothetical protein
MRQRDEDDVATECRKLSELSLLLEATSWKPFSEEDKVSRGLLKEKIQQESL